LFVSTSIKDERNLRSDVTHSLNVRNATVLEIMMTYPLNGRSRDKGVLLMSLFSKGRLYRSTAKGIGARSAAIAVYSLVMAVPAGAPLADVAESYVRLGNGGCRTAQGTTGKIGIVKDVTFDRCRRYCDESAAKYDRRCFGIEYNSSTGYCELHTTQVAYASGGSGPSACYKNICTGNGKLC
jgi:hypothetical protein